MTDEELIAELRKPWFTNGCERYQLDAADRIEALVERLTAAEQDAHEAEALANEALARAERLEAALRLLHDNVVLAFPTLADLGPVANARAALKGDDHA